MPAHSATPVLATHDVVGAAEVEGFYQMYERAFGPLRALAAARQVLTREEFFAEMADPRVTKYIARDPAGRALGVATLATDLECLPWISPEFYAAQFPELAARKALYFVGFILVDPGSRGRGAVATMIDAITLRVRDEKALCLFDMCRFNDQHLQLPDRIRDRSELYYPVRTEVLDTQTYYAMGPAAGWPDKPAAQ